MECIPNTPHAQGLQIPLGRFDSGPRLQLIHKLSPERGYFFGGEGVNPPELRGSVGSSSREAASALRSPSMRDLISICGRLCYSISMNAVLSPIVSEFETQEAADSHDQWFRSKVEASLCLADDPTTPRHSTDEVARRMAQVIKAAESKHATRRLA